MASNERCINRTFEYIMILNHFQCEFSEFNKEFQLTYRSQSLDYTTVVRKRDVEQ